MRVLPRSIAEQINDDQQVQLFQRLAPAGFAAHAEQGIAGDDHQGANGVVIIKNHVWQQVAGQGATDMAHFPMLGGKKYVIKAGAAGLGSGVEAFAVEIAAGLVQVAGNEAQHLQ